MATVTKFILSKRNQNDDLQTNRFKLVWYRYVENVFFRKERKGKYGVYQKRTGPGQDNETRLLFVDFYSEDANAKLDRMTSRVSRAELERAKNVGMDPLTRLPNVEKFRSLLHKATAGRGAQDKDLCLLAIGLDRFRLVNDQLRLFHGVTQDRHPAGPFAFAASGGDLVPCPFRDHLSFELGEGQEYVQNQPSHRRGRVECLRHAHEGHIVLLKRAHDLGEV